MAKIFFGLFLFITTGIFAQNKTEYPKTRQELEEAITKLDRQAFSYYNSCNIEKFKTFFTDDVEFYHDKNGITTTNTGLMEAMKKGICGNPDKKVRREADEKSLKVYPMEGYGAILEGEHLFYTTENKKERLTGKAKFVHVWLLQNGQWKMSRILSFDHKPL